MESIPIYLKTSPGMNRPTDPEFYLVSRNGTFIGRNHPFFKSDVQVQRPPKSLAPHSSSCEIRYPKLGTAALEYIVGFFDLIYQTRGAESIVLLLWNQRRHRYRLCVPEQEATVWVSRSGIRSAVDVTYEVPVPLPSDHLLVADIHCHCDFGAYASFTDEKDEVYRDGVHAVIGRIDREPPEFHLEFAVDGSRFSCTFDQLFKGYRRRRRTIPQKWLDAHRVKLSRAKSSTYTNYSSSSRPWHSNNRHYGSGWSNDA